MADILVGSFKCQAWRHPTTLEKDANFRYFFQKMPISHIFSKLFAYITYTKNKVEIPSFLTIPCLKCQLQRNRRYDFLKIVNPTYSCFPPFFENQFFRSNFWFKTCLNAIFSMEILLETISTLVWSLIMTLLKSPKMVFLRKLTKKSIFRHFFEVFRQK